MENHSILIRLGALDKDSSIESIGKALDDLEDINYQDSQGFTALHLLTMKGCVQGVRLVLQDPSASLDLQTLKKRTCLHWAVGSLECVKELLKDHRMTGDILSVRDIDGVTALDEARRRKRNKKIVKLIETAMEQYSLPYTASPSSSPPATPPSASKTTISLVKTNEYYEEYEPKPKVIKTEDNTALHEEILSYIRIISDHEANISKKEVKRTEKLQEELETQKLLRDEMAGRHKEIIDGLNREREEQEETFEKIRKDIQTKSQEDLQELEELEFCKRRRREAESQLFARLKSQELEESRGF